MAADPVAVRQRMIEALAAERIAWAALLEARQPLDTVWELEDFDAADAVMGEYAAAMIAYGESIAAACEHFEAGHST